MRRASAWCCRPISLNQYIGVQETTGIDVEVSYRFGMADLVLSFDGDVSLHGNATFHLRNFIAGKIAPDSNAYGVKTGPLNRRST